MSLEPLDFQDGDVQSDHGTERSWYNDSAILHYNQREDDLNWDHDEFNHDDAILHFNPGEPDLPLPPKPSPLLQTPVPTCTPSSTLNPVVPVPPDRAEQAKGRKARKPRSTKKRGNVQPDKPTQSTEFDDAELKSKLLDAIREDEEFYHRILRYDVRPFRFFEFKRCITNEMCTVAYQPGGFYGFGHNIRLPDSRIANKGREILG